MTIRLGFAVTHTGILPPLGHELRSSYHSFLSLHLLLRHEHCGRLSNAVSWEMIASQTRISPCHCSVLHCRPDQAIKTVPAARPLLLTLQKLHLPRKHISSICRDDVCIVAVAIAAVSRVQLPQHALHQHDRVPPLELRMPSQLKTAIDT